MPLSWRVYQNDHYLENSVKYYQGEGDYLGRMIVHSIYEKHPDVKNAEDPLRSMIKKDSPINYESRDTLFIPVARYTSNLLPVT